MDGMLCDRCGDIATHFHEDYGNVCPACAMHWSKRDDVPQDDCLNCGTCEACIDRSIAYAEEQQ